MSKPEKTYAVRCPRLLEVQGGKILDDQTLLIREGRIEKVHPTKELEVPSDCRSLELEGLTVLPGLIDVHTHLVEDHTRFAGGGPTQYSGAELALKAQANALTTLKAGFTSVRDLGTYRAFVDVALKDAINEGLVTGPGIQPVGAYITSTAGGGAVTTLAPDIELPRELCYGVANGPDEVRARVRAVIRRGAGAVKVMATGAVLGAGEVLGAQEFDEDEIRAAVVEAAKADIGVACHAHGHEGAAAAVAAGARSIEHGSLIEDSLLDTMVEKGTFLVCDLYTNDWISEVGESQYPKEMVAKNETAREAKRETFRNAVRKGVRFAYGTDAAVIPHGDNAKPFETLVENGMTPLRAIRSATLEAACLLGWEDRVGSLREGMMADIVAFDSNPLEDITTLQKPCFVMKGGEVVVS